jgi:2-dehydropantoate 2-reductase
MRDASRSVGVVGAGAVGTILAAHLERAGLRTVLVESGRRYDEVARDGLRVRGGVELNERPWRLARTIESLPEEERRSPGVWCLCTKAWSIASLLPSLRRALPEDVNVVGFQNGIGGERQLADALGARRVACTAVNFAGDRAEREGEIRLAWFNPPNYLGMCEGEEATAAQLADMLTLAGLDTEMASGREMGADTT